MGTTNNTATTTPLPETTTITTALATTPPIIETEIHSQTVNAETELEMVYIIEQDELEDGELISDEELEDTEDIDNENQESVTETEIEVTETEIIGAVDELLQEELDELLESDETQELELIVESVPVHNPTFMEQYGMILFLIAAGIIFYLYTSLKKEKEKRNINNDTSARNRDALRVENEKAKKQTNSKKKKKNISAKPKFTPSKVHDTLPYKKILDGDIWLIADNTYSRAYTFNDENYNLGDFDQQSMILSAYCSMLNTLDETIDCQISVVNVKINIDEFEKNALIPYYDDDAADLREEYNTRVLKENITKGDNSINKKLYFTLTIKTPDFEHAKRKFNTLDLSMKNSFSYQRISIRFGGQPFDRFDEH